MFSLRCNKQFLSRNKPRTDGLTSTQQIHSLNIVLWKWTDDLNADEKTKAAAEFTENRWSQTAAWCRLTFLFVPSIKIKRSLFKQKYETSEYMKPVSLLFPVFKLQMFLDCSHLFECFWKHEITQSSDLDEMNLRDFKLDGRVEDERGLKSAICWTARSRLLMKRSDTAEGTFM